MAGNAGNDFQLSSLRTLGYRRPLFSGSLGKGTYGKIYKVKDMQTGEMYAWKKIKKDMLERCNMTYSIYREKDALETLSRCPFIVNLYTSFQDRAFYCFIIEYVNEGQILDHIQGKGEMNIEATRHYGAELIMAIGHMRQHGWVHRDLKPENILLGADRHLRVCDFGFAKHETHQTYNRDPAGRALSTLAGTVNYMAPEVLSEQETTLDSDLWSLGCIIYEFHMGGQVYWYGQNISPNQQYRHIRDNSEYTLGFDESRDPSIKDLVDKLLMWEASDRLGSDSIDDLKRHAFFARILWDTLYMTPPPPLFVPAIPAVGAQAAAAPTTAAATVAIPTAPTVAPSGSAGPMLAGVQQPGEDDKLDDPYGMFSWSRINSPEPFGIDEDELATESIFQRFQRCCKIC